LKDFYYLKIFVSIFSTSPDSTQQSHLIPTTSRSSVSISDQMNSFTHRINDLCNKKSSIQLSNENQMDTTDINLTLPWKNLIECEELLKYLFNKNNDSIKRRQLLIQLQWLTNQSDEYRSQLFETIFKCCHSIYKEEFLNNFTKQYHISFVLLNILIKNQLLNDNSKKLINIFVTSNIEHKNIFEMKIKEFNHRIINQIEELNSEKILNINQILDILENFSSLNDSRIEKQFYKYFKLNNQHEDECKNVLINFLLQAEYRLSEPTIGMILDQLEKLDYKSSK
jgi:hypothetical protein